MKLRRLVVAGAVAAMSILMGSVGAQAEPIDTSCPYDNPNACCGWIYINGKGMKLFECW